MRVLFIYVPLIAFHLAHVHSLWAEQAVLQDWVVTAVTDGDSIHADSGGADSGGANSRGAGAVRLRLHGLDAPELKQTCFDAQDQLYPCGYRAREALRQLLPTGTKMACQHLDTDWYQRLIVRCFKEGRDINAEMVAMGWALAYRRYAKDYIAQEQHARNNRAGLWQGRFETPEEWRRRK